jgi:hypothetical protein
VFGHHVWQTKTRRSAWHTATGLECSKNEGHLPKYLGLNRSDNQSIERVILWTVALIYRNKWGLLGGLAKQMGLIGWIACAGPTVSTKLTNRLTDAVPILHTRAPVSTPCALALATVGAFYLRESSGNLAKFIACVPGQT